MTSFADSAATFIDARPNATERRLAWALFEAQGLPTTSDEVWRYAPLTDLDLGRFAVAGEPERVAQSPFATQLIERAGLVVRVSDGFAIAPTDELEGVSVDFEESSTSLTGDPLAVRYEGDSFALLNAALAPATTVIRVAAGVNVAEPIVVLNQSSSNASFSRTQLHIGRGASVTIVEYFEGGENGLVVPVSEYRVEDNASLQLVTYQRLDHSAWHVARTTGHLARDARLHQAVVGFGAHYDRSRNDAELLGPGAANELRTTFLGSGDQVHDFRTRQYHVAGRTTSTLLSKGAVADSSRSVYTGLIEIEKGAKRTDARQTNHNLLLSKSAHADSVPNLDIRENDVMCAHASSVGPLDDLQLWYLESRGVTPEEAQRLLIQGFFYEMLSALPSELAELVERDVATVLSHVAEVVAA